MTLAQKVEQRGRQEGIKEGVSKTAIRMLSEGADPVFVAKCTDLTLEEVKKLSESQPKNDNIQ